MVFKYITETDRKENQRGRVGKHLQRKAQAGSTEPARKNLPT
jgi:hypothetical protein